MEPVDKAQNSGTELCLACGLCCDGSLFYHGILNPDEPELALSAGFQLVRRREEMVFPQPCRMFQGGCCSIYKNWRPRVCGEYQCRLLKNRSLGKITQLSALELIARVRDQQQSMAKFFAGVPPTIAMVRQEVKRLSEAGESARSEHAEFLMQAAIYEFLLQRNFLEDAGKVKKAQGMKDGAV